MNKNQGFLFSLFLIFFNFSETRSVCAQYREPGFCDIAPSWDKIEIVNDSIPRGFAKILIITNRPYVENEPEFLPNDIALYRKVTYLIAACDGEKWLMSVVKDFAEGVAAINNGRDMLLFIEGHGKSFPMMLSRAYQVQARYNTSLLVFDWPSENNNFNSSIARVRRCGDNFYNLLLQVREYRKQKMNEQQHFSIVAHSLGNYFLSHMVVCGDAQYFNEVFVDNIIMNAPAIRSKEHGEVLSQLAFQRRLYITSNKNDWVLHGAKLLTSGKMLGNLAIKPLAQNACYLNFTLVAGKEHSYYFGYHDFEHSNPAFYYFYHTAFHGNEVNLQDTGKFVSRESGDGYNIISLE